MAKYETLVSEYVDYGQNRFIELSKKKIYPDGAIFFNISKGYYTPEKERKYQGGIGFPADAKLIADMIKKLGKVNK